MLLYMGRLCCKAPAPAARQGRPARSSLKNRGTTQIARRTVRPGHSTAPLTRAYENGYKPAGSKGGSPADGRCGVLCRQKRFPRSCSEATAPAPSAPAFTFPGSLVKPLLRAQSQSQCDSAPRLPRAHTQGSVGRCAYRRLSADAPAGALFLTAFLFCLIIAVFARDVKRKMRRFIRAKMRRFIRAGRARPNPRAAFKLCGVSPAGAGSRTGRIIPDRCPCGAPP